MLESYINTYFYDLIPDSTDYVKEKIYRYLPKYLPSTRHVHILPGSALLFAWLHQHAFRFLNMSVDNADFVGKSYSWR